MEIVRRILSTSWFQCKCCICPWNWAKTGRKSQDWWRNFQVTFKIDISKKKEFKRIQGRGIPSTIELEDTTKSSYKKPAMRAKERRRVSRSVSRIYKVFQQQKRGENNWHCQLFLYHAYRGGHYRFWRVKSEANEHRDSRSVVDCPGVSWGFPRNFTIKKRQEVKKLIHI